jgi:hypothetical protein
MKLRFVLFWIFVVIGILLIIQPLRAQMIGEQNIIYQTTFTTNPGWQTNNPSQDYWDPNKEMYHYGIEASTGGYAYVTVDYDRGPFTLEYDWMPLKTDDTATFRFGLGSEEMDRSGKTIAISEFSNGKNGKLMYLRVITPNSRLVSVASGQGDELTPSYGGPTVRFEDNQTYHVILDYNDELNTVNMQVSDKNTGRQIWSYYVNIYGSLSGMDRLFLGSIGDHGMANNVAEGYIDNIKLYTKSSVTTTPTPISTTPTILSVTLKKLPTLELTTESPTPTPTSPSSPMFMLIAFGIAFAVFYSSKNCQK